MGQPGLPGSQFPSEDAIGRRIKDLERAVQELRSANQLAPAGIRAIDGGIVVEGSETVNGPLSISGTMGVTGNADFTGNVRIGGTLDLPAGIIGNDALAAPIKMAAIYADADGFTLTPTEADFCAATFTVPDGYTTALVKVDGTVNAYNTNSSADYLWARAYIDANYGRRLFNLMDATSGPASLAVNKQLMLTGLAPGQIITCKLKLSTQTGTVTSGSNGASMNASALFTR